MTPYYALVSARFRTLIQYRAAAMAGMATQLFWGLIRTMIFDAFYRSTTRPMPLSHDQTITYIWLGQALLALLPWSYDSEVRDKIRSGAVVYELLRPLDLYAHWYCRDLAARVAPTLLRSIPLVLIAGLFFGLKAPATPAAAFGWALMTLNALLVNCAFSNLITISMLWTVSGEGIRRAAPPVVYLLSGMLIPLQFLPAWSQPLVRFLPFRNMVDIPFRVYMGNIPVAQLGPYLAQSLLWTAVMVAIGRAMLWRGTRHLVVQGG